MAIYRRLFFNNLFNLFSKNFPLAKSILGTDDWRRLVRAFMAGHRPVTPLFPEIGREMVRFLDESGAALEGYPRFLADLVRYEYLETAVRNDEAEIADLSVNSDGDLIEGIPVANPTARLAQFTWPVHEINADNRPGHPPDEATILVVYRRRDDRVSFLRVNPVTARLIERVQENTGMSGLALLESIAREMNHPDQGVVVRGGKEILAALHHRQVILGTRP